MATALTFEEAITTLAAEATRSSRAALGNQPFAWEKGITANVTDQATTKVGDFDVFTDNLGRFSSETEAKLYTAAAKQGVDGAAIMTARRRADFMSSWRNAMVARHCSRVRANCASASRRGALGLRQLQGIAIKMVIK